MGAVKKTSVSEEVERIKVLKKYEILDTPPDGSFDRITKLAAQMLDMPIAIVSLVDEDRIWFKSRYGLEAQEIGRDPGLCASAILGDDLYLVTDAKKDPRTLSNPLVASKFGLRFYAAVPLKTKEGYKLGTFCIIDKKPRHLTRAKREILQNLGDMVMSQMELRLEARQAIKHQHHILNITAHDLKNPLSMMPLLADMILEHKNNPEAIDDIARQIKEGGKRMNDIINDLLETARKETGKVQLRLKVVDLCKLVKGVVSTNNSFAKRKNQLLQLHLDGTCKVFGDQHRLTEIADNLVNNAIKFSPLSTEINVYVQVKRKHAIIEVKDEGPGLTQDDMKNLFRQYTSLSAKPTGGEISSGIGLSITKSLVNAHRGKIYAKSNDAGKGATFVVELPLSLER